MIFRLPFELMEFNAYLNELKEKECNVELKEIKGKRSIPQNSYLHLLLAAFGLEFGYTIEEAKLIYKRQNKELYVYEKNGSKFIKSSADLTKEELIVSIERFKEYSAKNGLILPEANDMLQLNEINIEAKKSVYL